MARILVYSDRFFPISETFIYRQIQALGEANELVLLCHSFSNPHDYKVDGVNVQVVPHNRNLFEKGVSHLVGRFFNQHYKLRFGVPKKICNIISLHSFDIAHIHYGWNALKFLPYAKKFNLPLVVSFHGNDACPSTRRREYLEGLLQLFDYAQSIILCTGDMIQRLPLGAYMHKVKVIPYGIDLDVFNNTALNDRNDLKRIVLMHSGRIVSKKGVFDLILVFAKLVKIHRHIELQIVGDGPEFIKCVGLVEDLDLRSKVKFHGRLAQHNVIDVMKSADIFVLNSRTDEDGNMEGLPNALLEAMSMRLAVVSTNHAGISNAVVNGLNGILVPEKDNDSLLNALDTLINDKQLRCKLANMARQTVAMHFDKKVTNAALRKIFDKRSTTI